MVVTSLHLTTVAIAESELSYLRRRQRTDHVKVMGRMATRKNGPDTRNDRVPLTDR
jgi:hypothetical protein